MSNKPRRDSALVKAVLALDGYLAELDRIGTKINSTDMTSDFDSEHIQKLMSRFAECGQGIAVEVSNLSRELQDAQARSEAITQGVSKQAELLNLRRKDQNEKLEQFRLLGDKARELNIAISRFQPGDSEELKASISQFETQLLELIEDLQNLRKSARDSRMKALEKSAESLLQALQSVRNRLPKL